MSQVVSIDKDSSFVWLMQAQQQICESCFASATTPYESDCLTRLDFEIDVLKRVFVRTRWITKSNILKSDAAANTRQPHTLLIIYVLGFGIKYVVQPFETNADFLKFTPQIYDAQYWSSDTSDEHVKGYELANRQIANHHKTRAIPEENNRVERLQHIANRDCGHSRQSTPKLHVKALDDQSLKLPANTSLASRCFYRTNARN